MYPIELKTLLGQNVLKEPIMLLSCISFEDRCKTASRIAYEVKGANIQICFFKILDNYSFYRDKCTEKQNKNEFDLRNLLNLRDIEIPEFNMIDQNIELKDNVINYFKSCYDQNKSNTIIIDVTTIPKICYFPFLEWMLDVFSEDSDLLIVYTKPIEYGDNPLHSQLLAKNNAAEKLEIEGLLDYEDEFYLECDPIPPKFLMGRLGEDVRLLWIPCLGFNSRFTFKIWENLQNGKITRKISEFKIMPLLGFPAYRHDYYDKSLLAHANAFRNCKEFRASLSNKKQFFAEADDPFDVFNRIEEKFIAYNNYQLLLSPIGPKPMSIGIALAAIIKKIPVFAIQAKSYNPNYSIGEGDSLVYWIKKDKNYTFTTGE